MDINLPMSPPVNNNIQTTLCDRLDAVVFEKIRVVNTQLDARLSIQEKIINKYRHDVEKIHARQTRRIKREVKQIRQKKPDYVIDDSDVSTSKSQNTSGTGRQRCMSEPSNLSYCRRYYSHHYNVKEAKKDDKKDKDGDKHGNDFFNMKMRLYFVNMMNNVRQKTHLQHDVADEHSTAADDHLSRDNQIPQSHFLTKFPNENANTDVVGDAGDLNRARNEEKNETNSVHNANEEKEEGDKVFHDTDLTAEIPVSHTTDIAHENPRDINANRYWDGNKGRRRSKGGKSRRKSFLGSGSEEELVYNEAERRKAKHAFEKIFSGLL